MINFEEDEAHFGKISSLLCPGLNGRKDKKKNDKETTTENK